MAPVNGLIDPASEHAQRQRESFRDEVSKRMGELLLKGQTMLDEYCQTCSGIIMEDRNAVRRCVTCEVYQEKTTEGSHIVAQIPLDEEDFDHAPDMPSTTVTHVTRDYSSYVDYDDMEETNTHPKVVAPQEKKTTKKTSGVKSVTPKKKQFSEDDDVSLAKAAVGRKLRWASQKLDEEKSYNGVLEILQILKVSAETLEVLNRI